MTKKQMRRATSQYRHEVREAYEWACKHDRPLKSFYAELLMEMDREFRQRAPRSESTNGYRRAA